VCALAGEKVELIGTVVDANGSLVHAKESPTLLYQDQIISADEMTYDHNSSIVEAIGSVNAFKAGQYHAISDYSKLNLETDTRYSKPYFMFDQASGAWIGSDEAKGCENKVDLSSGMLSGCDAADPLWKIHFSSADYDTQAQWVNIYNARLYIEDVPVMYLPYFGYPTDRTRRSGLLIPTFGLSSDEGLFYEQPIYWAPTNWFDATFRPQIRTSRGSGAYVDMRFVDSPHSKGSIQLGYFKEQSDYVEEKHLANDVHYGYGFNYEHRGILQDWFGLDSEAQTGLYVDASWMNDVDYFNLLRNRKIDNVTAHQILSRANGFYDDGTNYLGTYFKYYKDLTTDNNDQTLQTLPTLQYHRYTQGFLQDHLLINGDVSANNFYRPNGTSATQSDFKVPVVLQTSLFDDFLDVSYTADGFVQTTSFYGTPLNNEPKSNYSSGYYAQLAHIFALSSSLTKGYGDLTHVVVPSVSYVLAGKREYDGYYDDYRNSCDVSSSNYAGQACEFFNIEDPSDKLSLGFDNFLFDTGKQFLVDRLRQTFRYGNGGGSYYGELQNELEWEITQAISYYNQTSYNDDRNRITKEQNTLRYHDTAITAGISNYYTDDIYDNNGLSDVRYTSYWTADASYQYNRYYRAFGKIAYDYHESITKHVEVGFLYTQRCWDLGVRLVNNRRPILTNDSTTNSYIDDSYVFVSIALKPIGGSEFSYKTSGN
jgi:LPS-assembly protein